jgi:hypothetical protein
LIILASGNAIASHGIAITARSVAITSNAIVVTARSISVSGNFVVISYIPIAIANGEIIIAEYPVPIPNGAIVIAEVPVAVTNGLIVIAEVPVAIASGDIVLGEVPVTVTQGLVVVTARGFGVKWGSVIPNESWNASASKGRNVATSWKIASKEISTEGVVIGFSHEYPLNSSKAAIARCSQDIESSVMFFCYFATVRVTKEV